MQRNNEVLHDGEELMMLHACDAEPADDMREPLHSLRVNVETYNLLRPMYDQLSRPNLRKILKPQRI